METGLAALLRSQKDDIAQAWAEAIHRSSDRYRRQPLEDIRTAASAFLDGLAEAAAAGSFDRLDEAVRNITVRRSAMGFEPEELQRALMLGCEVIFPRLQTEYGQDARRLVWSVAQVERAVEHSLAVMHRAMYEARVSSLRAEVERAQAERLAAERRLAAVARALRQGILVVDTGLRLLWADEQAKELLEGQGQAGEPHSCGGTQDPTTCALAAAAQTGTVQRAQAPTACLVMLAAPVSTPEGEIVEVVGLTRPL